MPRLRIRDVFLGRGAWDDLVRAEYESGRKPACSGRSLNPLERRISRRLATWAGGQVRQAPSEIRDGYFLGGSLSHAALGRLSGDERKFAVAWWSDCRGATLKNIGLALGISKERARQLRVEGRVLLAEERQRRLRVERHTEHGQD